MVRVAVAVGVGLGPVRTGRLTRGSVMSFPSGRGRARTLSLTRLCDQAVLMNTSVSCV